jgi:pimeloyl-ACP methyl ester carboxylesterase
MPDGYTLHAGQYGSGSRGVVLVHGGRFNKESWKKQAETLAQNGFYALAFDFRGHGQTILGTQTADEKHYPDHGRGRRGPDCAGAPRSRYRSDRD